MLKYTKRKILRARRKMSKELEAYYNKFCEEKRLTRRHGNVEFITSMKYIHKYLEVMPKDAKILDIGAGTGRYSVALAEEGYDVTAVELVKYNLGILKQKNSNVKAYQGNALKLKRFADETFDLTLLFGPMYHLFGKENKIQALSEAKRVTKKGGIIMVAYCMNEYGVISYAFKKGNLKTCMEEHRLDEQFHCRSEEKDLYDYVRVEDINRLMESAGLKRIKLISPDGPANYIRPALKEMTEEEFELFIQYQEKVAERQELVGAGAHTVDILQKVE